MPKALAAENYSPTTNKKLAKVSNQALTMAKEADSSKTQAFAVLEAAPDPVIIIDNNNLINMVNAQTEEVFGYKREELVGKPFELLIPMKFHTKHFSYFDQYKENQKKQSVDYGQELIAIRKDGSKFPIEITHSSLMTKEGELIVTAVRDISERKHLEMVMQESEHRFKKIFNEAPLGIALINSDTGTIHSMNSMYCKVAGRTEEELKTIDWMSITHPDDVQKDLNQMALMNAGKIPGFNMDKRYILPDGTISWFHMTVTPINFKEKASRFHLCMLIDINKRKHAEENLQIQIDLAKTLVSELEKSNHELEQFAYVASHDLKAPLRGIDNLAQWIEEDLEETLVGETKKHMGLLRKRVFRLENLLDDLLAYSRAGKSKDTTLVNCNQMVRDIADLYKRPGLSINIHDSLPTFITQRAAIELVFRNLINNAIKHHDRNKINVSISATKNKEFYRFIVKDDGPGIDPKYHKSIFDMFKTLKSRDEVEGSGMGLAIIKKVIKNLGGKIWVDTEVDKRGTSFIFNWKTNEKGDT